MAERLNKPLLYTFGVGDLFFALLSNMEVFYFNAFLTDYAKFSLVITSVVVYVTGIGDIICALAAGVILQRLSVKLKGGYRSWLLLCPPLVVPLFILQFSRIGTAYTAAGLIIFGFLASHLLWNVGYAATGALVGSLSQRSDERTVLSSSRAQGMTAAGLIFSFTGPQMIAFFGPLTSDVIGYTITIAVFGILMILGYLYVYKITAVGGPSANIVIDTEDKENRKSLMEILGLVFRNPPLLLLIVAETFRNTGIFFILTFAFYYFGYVLDSPAFLSVFIFATSLVAFFGAVAAAWIGVKLGKRNTYWISLILSAVIFLSAVLIEANTWSFTIIFCVATMLCWIAGSMSTALFADTVVYGEWKTGKNIQAFTMSLLTMPLKFGLLIRSGIIMVGLMTIGFVANTTPTPEVVNGINSIMIFSPAITCAIAAVVFYFGYRIEEEDVVQMQEEIATR